MITGETYQKLTELASSYQARRGFQPKNSNEIIDRDFFIDTATDNENIHPTQIYQMLFTCYNSY